MGNEKSLLQKLHRSYSALRTAGGTPTLELITNRTLDGTHPLLGHVDGRTDLLVPYATLAGPKPKPGKPCRRGPIMSGYPVTTCLRCSAISSSEPG